ncbi:hypothetical protein DEU56DRAFT_753685 [Suillus clintonianus]|uniref:uncharacterized protein n=1 Tax=Suillus clintonianus TaxID=1904413 RepID=UPI001B885141|nr:uncharacterized protein DEU56DRAFT_753685 [Suillus clintonianus]KAG2146819.1 hypothetical protein DEU56DRAFT_753685 [Suillus clintonianus]
MFASTVPVSKRQVLGMIVHDLNSTGAAMRQPHTPKWALANVLVGYAYLCIGSLDVGASVYLLSIALPSITGGTAAHYRSWRSLHFSLGVWGITKMVLIYMFFRR